MRSILMALILAFALVVPAMANDHAGTPPAAEKSAPAKAEKAVEKKVEKKKHKAKKHKKAKTVAKEETKPNHNANELKIGPVPKVND